MPMDRLSKTLAGCGLALLATAAGCRATRDEVPPGRAFRNDGKADRGAEFSTQPHPGPTPSLGNQIGGTPGNRVSGPVTLPPPGDAFGIPPDGKYGAPGNSGLGPAPALSNGTPAPSTYPPKPPEGRGRMSEPDAGPSPY